MRFVGSDRPSAMLRAMSKLFSPVLIAFILAVAGCGAGCQETPLVDHQDLEGTVDGGRPVDAGTDAGPSDAGALDAGDTDAGPIDAGSADAGPADAGAMDAGGADAGAADAGSVDAGPTDAGPIDAGTPVLRFTALGDAGKGNEKQYAVGAAMKTVCDARGGCSFAVYLGDNFYPSGVAAIDDDLFRTHFELPYAALEFPFWVVLGNHDYGGNGAGYEFWKTDHEVNYSLRNPKWKMPAKNYTFTEGPIDFIALDTNAIFWGYGDEQKSAMAGRLAASTKPWQVALGHHPYLSNGKHGNAGNYDKIPCPVFGSESLCRTPSGLEVKRFMESEICGKVDVYLCGHDHNMQDLGTACGTEFVVSGAGANTTPLSGSNPNHFQSDASGFFLVEVTPTKMTFTAFDENATQLHTRTIIK